MNTTSYKTDLMQRSIRFIAVSTAIACVLGITVIAAQLLTNSLGRLAVQDASTQACFIETE